MRIGDYFTEVGFSGSFIDGSNDFYHRLVFWPDWVKDSLRDFTNQVMDMASSTRPFKITDTFKLQSGFPHEISTERKEELLQSGIKRDYVSAEEGVVIPKIDIHKFIHILEGATTNVLILSTPQGKQYIRDITVVDDESHAELAFIYVVNRRAQVITGWAERKRKGKFYLELPKNILKSLSYITD